MWVVHAASEPVKTSVEYVPLVQLFRMRRWAKLLRGDMKEVYETYGYPSTRYREEVLGRTIEKWTYIAEGRQFVFQEGELIREKEFNPGSPWGDIMHRHLKSGEEVGLPTFKSLP